jgi:hypothetical protein
MTVNYRIRHLAASRLYDLISGIKYLESILGAIKKNEKAGIHDPNLDSARSSRINRFNDLFEGFIVLVLFAGLCDDDVESRLLILLHGDVGPVAFKSG